MPAHRSSDSWKEGDILFLKKWDTNTEEVYQSQNIPKNVTDHPVVLLHRPSSDSEYLVVATMTSLNGRPLSEHAYAQSSKARRRAYVAIKPAPTNPKNTLLLTMLPKPMVKQSYINATEILCVPAKVLNRFADRGGHNYSLSSESFLDLIKFIKREPAKWRKMIATAMSRQTTYECISDRHNIPAHDNTVNLPSHIIPVPPAGPLDAGPRHAGHRSPTLLSRPVSLYPPLYPPSHTYPSRPIQEPPRQNLYSRYISDEEREIYERQPLLESADGRTPGKLPGRGLFYLVLGVIAVGALAVLKYSVPWNAMAPTKSGPSIWSQTVSLLRDLGSRLSGMW